MSISNEIIDFINKSPSVFHVVDNFKKMLNEHGFTELLENKSWELNAGGKYFVTRNNSSILAFVYPKDDFKSYGIIASHSDSPCFKLKDNFKVETLGNYTKLNTEPYGGMILSTWFDRPVSVAGRVQIKNGNKIMSKLVNIDKDLAVIPSMPIHLNREANNGEKFNPQIALMPLVGGENANILEYIKKEISSDDILSHDLFLYQREKGKKIGLSDEYILSPKIDNLSCAFMSMKALIESENQDTVMMSAVFDNEEVGSSTKQGADSNFLKNTLRHIAKNKNDIDFNIALSNSFMVSADNGHAVHPNFPEKYDSTNKCFMNKGIVIKYNANQKYTSDGISTSVYKMICDKAGVLYQSYHNRSDIAGGSTLGNISNTQISMNTIDIGLPQLAMHSAVETCGTKDCEYMIGSFKEFYKSVISIENDNIEVL